MRRWILLPTVAAIVLALIPTAPAAASDTVTRWESFSESSSCGAPYTRGPFASKSGSLPSSEPVLGPYGTYFGRTIAEISGHIRYWTVPYSGGRRIRVHEAMLPALDRVRANLEAEALAGHVYTVTSAAAFVSRTVGGSYQISRHAMGLAIDINPIQNPYRSDGKLITNMPRWYVDAWTKEGFCWGGDWSSTKDPMHFSWMGPAATPSPSDSLSPTPPKTAKTQYSGPVATHDSEFAGVTARYALALADGTGNGVPDVMGLRAHPSGSVIDVASSTYGYGACSVFRWFVPNKAVASADHVLFADIDGDSGQDLIALRATGGSSLTATVASRQGRFEDLADGATGADATSVAFAGADFDGDHIADLWEVTSSNNVRIWKGPAFTSLLSDRALPGAGPVMIAAGDRDGGDQPELFALRDNSRVDVLRLAGDWAVESTVAIATPTAEVAALAAGDYDGDGRADLETLSSSGQVAAYVGNSSTGIPANRWFLNPNWKCGESQPLTLDFHGTFMDDDGRIFEQNIEAIAASGVTKGCNPPFNDRFCPRDVVTRETMAAFLVRALGLTENDHPGFVDVPAGSTFAEDIGRLATAGITKGCNPPANDRFCPKAAVSRETMAAFLVRALGLVDDSHAPFRDVASTSTFAQDIRRLAAAGITKGCNPPRNDLFCPRDVVTRETMSAFLDRGGFGS